jgi:hypothetical protein
MLEEGIVQIVQSALASKPELAVAVTVISVSRAIMKPLCALVIAYVEASPSKGDDQMLADLRENVWFKKVMWVMDLLFSVKLPEIKKNEVV